MKLSVLEPLGVDQGMLEDIGKKAIGDSFQITYHTTRKEDTETLISRCKDADVVMLSNFPFTREVMKECPNLKMICVAFTGTDHIDMEYCREHNIMVTNASGYATVGVSELVYGLVLSLYRNIIPCDQRTREGGTKDGLVGMELAGKKIGIVGAGAIGLATGTIGKAFGCEILLYNGENAKTVEGMTSVDLETLLRESDIVSLHTPLTPNTKGLIGEKELEIMKKSSILINTARGPVVDNDALAKALINGVIAGAGIDVFDMEPPLPKDYPLLHAPNTIVTPHVAFATKESMVKRGIIAFENVRQWKNDTPQNIV